MNRNEINFTEGMEGNMNMANENVMGINAMNEIGDNMNNIDIVNVKLVKESSFSYDKALNTPGRIAEFAAKIIGDNARETLLVINMNHSKMPINAGICSMGSVSRTMADPKEIVKSTILSNASCVALVHNHPTGRVVPSQMDEEMTDRFIELAKLLMIAVVDHVIIGPDGSYYSFAEDKVFKPGDEKKRPLTVGVCKLYEEADEEVYERVRMSKLSKLIEDEIVSYGKLAYSPEELREMTLMVAEAEDIYVPLKETVGEIVKRVLI